MNDRTLKALNSLPKREVPNFKISARSIQSPKAKSKTILTRPRVWTKPAPPSGGWFPDDPKKPFIKGPKIPEEVAPVNRSNDYSFFKEADVNVLTKSSLQKVRDIARGRLGNLVIRRVKKILPSKGGEYRHYLHSPEDRKLISQEEFDQLSDEVKFTRVETIFKGEYSLITSKKSPTITRDHFEGQAFFAKSSGRAEFDPMTLNLELAEDRPMPRGSNNKNTNEDDPASLICGYAVRDPMTKKLVLKKWTIISIQEQRAILALVEPTVIHPSTKKGEIKDADSYRAWLLGAGRLSTNLFRRKVLSEKAAKTPFTAEEKEKIYTRYCGSAWGLHHCHILVFWTLMCRYGELPGDDNVPTVVPTVPPKDPEKLAEWYEDKPLLWWDLPRISIPIEGKKKPRRIRMDEYLIEKLGLEFTKQRVLIPVHERVRFPQKVVEPPPLENQEGQNDVAELVLAPITLTDSLDTIGSGSLDRTSSPANFGSETDSDSETTSGILTESLDSGLSSDSETSRSATPSTEIEVIAQEAWVFKSNWADLADEDGEMDFDAPLTLSPLPSSLTSSVDDSLFDSTEVEEKKNVIRDTSTEKDLVDDLLGSSGGTDGVDDGWIEAKSKGRKSKRVTKVNKGQKERPRTSRK